MTLPKTFFICPGTQFLVKFLKHNRFNIRTYNIKNKNTYLMYDIDDSFIVKDYLIYSSFKQNEQTLELILQRKYDGE